MEKLYVKNLPRNDIKIYGMNYVDLSINNSEFLNEVRLSPETAVKRFIRYNEDYDLFTKNQRYIGGSIQMYKVYADGRIDNLSEPPFN